MRWVKNGTCGAIAELPQKTNNTSLCSGRRTGKCYRRPNLRYGIISNTFDGQLEAPKDSQGKQDKFSPTADLTILQVHKSDIINFVEKEIFRYATCK